MSNAWTTDRLIESWRTRSYFPSGTGLTTEQVLALMSEEQGLYVMAFLKSIREEFTVASLDIAVDGDPIPLPVRAAGAALRTIAWVSDDASGNQYPLARIEPEQRSGYAQSSTAPQGYMFEGNTIILLPTVSTGTLRVSYQQRPGFLVLPEACGLVTDIADTVTVTVDAVPSTFVAGALCDFVPGTPNFVPGALDLEIDAVSGLDVSFTEAITGRVAVGDFVCLAGQSCIPPFPIEVHQVLAQRTAEVIAAATGSKRLDAIRMDLMQARADATALLSPRTDGSVRPIVRRGGAGSRAWWW